MPSLKEFVDMQPITGMSDTDIIREWFCQNGCEETGLELITTLSKSKIDKLKTRLNYITTWAPNMIDVYRGNGGEVPLDIAERLNTIIRYRIIDQPLPESLLNWAKETIPTINTPKVIFVPMVEWLKEEYGVEFKDKMI